MQRFFFNIFDPWLDESTDAEPSDLEDRLFFKEETDAQRCK